MEKCPFYICTPIYGTKTLLEKPEEMEIRIHPFLHQKGVNTWDGRVLVAWVPEALLFVGEGQIFEETTFGNAGRLQIGEENKERIRRQYLCPVVLSTHCQQSSLMTHCYLSSIECPSTDLSCPNTQVRAVLQATTVPRELLPHLSGATTQSTIQDHHCAPQIPGIQEGLSLLVTPEIHPKFVHLLCALKHSISQRGKRSLPTCLKCPIQ